MLKVKLNEHFSASNKNTMSVCWIRAHPLSVYKKFSIKEGRKSSFLGETMLNC